MLKMKWGTYRHPKTTAEKRANQNTKYARAKRKGWNLPCVYDDIPVYTSRCWKDKRKKQYIREKREKYTFFLKINNNYPLRWMITMYVQRKICKFEDYCKINNISYEVVKIGQYYKLIWWYHKDIGIHFIINGY